MLGLADVSVYPFSLLPASSADTSMQYIVLAFMLAIIYRLLSVLLLPYLEFILAVTKF